MQDRCRVWVPRQGGGRERALLRPPAGPVRRGSLWDRLMPAGGRVESLLSTRRRVMVVVLVGVHSEGGASPMTPFWGRQGQQ